MTNSNRRLDRRVRRTRRQLRDALRKLIQQQPYNDITIKSIVDEADISRATFYLHYKKKDDLLLKCFSSLEEDVAERLDNTGGTHISLYDLALLMFTRVMENRTLYNKLKDTNDLASVMNQQVQEMIPIIEVTLHATQTDPTLMIGLLACQIAGALSASASWWLENDLDSTPEQMATTALNQLHSAIPRVLRSNSTPDSD